MSVFHYKAANRHFGLKNLSVSLFSPLFTHYLKLSCSCSPPAAGSASQAVMHHQNRFGLSGYGPGLLRQKTFRAKRATAERMPSSPLQDDDKNNRNYFGSLLCLFVSFLITEQHFSGTPGQDNGALVNLMIGPNSRASSDPSEAGWFGPSSLPPR